MLKPIVWLEKISKKNPAATAKNNPKFFLGFSIIFHITAMINKKFGIKPRMLKWTKKLVWETARK
jgi:hypothetical protein